MGARLGLGMLSPCSVVVLKIDFAHVRTVPGESDDVVSADVYGVCAFPVAFQLVKVFHAGAIARVVDAVQQFKDQQDIAMILFADAAGLSRFEQRLQSLVPPMDDGHRVSTNVTSDVTGGQGREEKEG